MTHRDHQVSLLATHGPQCETTIFTFFEMICGVSQTHSTGWDCPWMAQAYIARIVAPSLCIRPELDVE